MSKPSVHIFMPCGSTPEPKALTAAMQASAWYGAPLAVPAHQPRDANRNLCVSRFLQSKAEYMLFIDSDTVVPRDVIDRLLAIGKPNVCGVQPLLMFEVLVANVMPFKPPPGDERAVWPRWVEYDPNTEPFLVQYCGFGCVLLHRSTFDQWDFPWFVEFHGDRHGRNNVTEDIHFCRMLYRSGGEMWCAPNVICGHIKKVDLRTIVPRSEICEEGAPVAFRNVPGWLAACGERLFSAALTRQSQCGDALTWVHVGVFHGRSLAYCAELAMRRDIDVTLLGVDHFCGSAEHGGKQVVDMRAQAEQRLRPFGLGDRIELIESESVAAAERFADGWLDLVYLDASHDRESVAADLAAWWPKVAAYGLLCGDDYAPEFPGVMKAVDEFAAAEGLELRIDGRTWRLLRPGQADPLRPAKQLAAEAMASAE